MPNPASLSFRSSATAIAVNRFGLGARMGEDLPASPQRWLAGQLDRYDPRPSAWQAILGAVDLISDVDARREQAVVGLTGASEVQAARQQVNQQIGKDQQAIFQQGVNARLATALSSPAPFVERMVAFWSNHFAVSTDKLGMPSLAAAFEKEAIRPHVLGPFRDLLLAVEQHPAMIQFLDQANSVGPNSPAVLNDLKHHPDHHRGLNENLAREIMELHTLGVRAGYTQADVTEFARALTGWGLANGKGKPPGNQLPGMLVFRPEVHEPGPRTVMGIAYDQPGGQQAVAILNDLARAPATYRHLAFQLARHVVADQPPPALVQRLVQTFQASDGNLIEVYQALIDDHNAWAPAPVKFKTPWEWLVSALRGLGLPVDVLGEARMAGLLNQLGQPVWRPGSPAGYDDVAASWAAPDALLRRVEVAQRLAAKVGDRVDPAALSEHLLAGPASPVTAQQIAHAESVPAALALLLVSPEFLRR